MGGARLRLRSGLQHHLPLGNTEHPELTRGRKPLRVNEEATEVHCLLEKYQQSKVAPSRYIATYIIVKKLKLIAIMNYCFKQELHKLLWFNDNDKDNINEMKLFEN